MIDLISVAVLGGDVSKVIMVEICLRGGGDGGGVVPRWFIDCGLAYEGNNRPMKTEDLCVIVNE